MRRDGDRLITHLAQANQTVLLCAPFIKARVLKNLLRHIRSEVSVKVVTRWLPAEVALGVSDLEVFDVLEKRAFSSLWLLNRLHAKLYVADGEILIGSANLTATALGWSEEPNLELLTRVDLGDEPTRLAMEQLSEARQATRAERDEVEQLAHSIEKPSLSMAVDLAAEAMPSLWLPRLPAPKRLFQAYVERARERLTPEALSAALQDLHALGLPPSLTENGFNSAVASALLSMPAIARILASADDDLTDEAGIQIVQEIVGDNGVAADMQWLIVREWLTHFFSDRYEIAPQAFVLRRKPGASRQRSE
jgi:hypothetical protein